MINVKYLLESYKNTKRDGKQYKRQAKTTNKDINGKCVIRYLKEKLITEGQDKIKQARLKTDLSLMTYQGYMNL